MISEKLESILISLRRSGDAQQQAVADFLHTVASNGGDQDSDAFLAICAAELAEAANDVRDRLFDLHSDAMIKAHVQDWRDEAATGCTRLGFADWVWNNYEKPEELHDGDATDGDVGDTQS